MARHARETYPHECVGFLIGRWKEPRSVTRVRRATNRETARAADRFDLDPREHLALERELAAAKGDAAGGEIVGFYHSHPDHPPRPSETDRGWWNPWPGYSFVIVACAGGKETELKSWRQVGETGVYEEEVVAPRPTPAPAASPKAAKSVAPAADRPLRVLVADDQEDDRRLLRRVLESMGVRDIREATSGSDAFVELNLSRPDLVIFDWLMPFRDGLSLVREFRGEGGEAPVILVTAVADQANVETAKSSGVDAYITKPFTLRHLRETISAVIREKLPEFAATLRRR